MNPVKEICRILSNRKIATDHFIVEFRSHKISPHAQPGQFVQILLDEQNGLLLPRPFSFLDAHKNRFRILYQVVGKGTQVLSKMRPGHVLRVLGPLGNGFSVCGRRALLIGGGVGIPPLYHWAGFLLRESKPRYSRDAIEVFLGARKRDFLHCERDFKRLGLKVKVATEDGSKGHRGFVTEILDWRLTGSLPEGTTIYTCGPTAMLRAVSILSMKYDVPCQVSVEEIMPCGFGACLGCAIKVRHKTQDPGHRTQDDVGYRYAMSCCEGPVFHARDILWE